MLLRDSNTGGQGPALLVVPVGEDGDFIHCRFIGSVQEFSPRPPEGYDSRCGYAFFKIGQEDNRPDVEARKFIKPLPYPEDILWLFGKLWMGDQPFTGQLLVTRWQPQTDSARAYSLEATDDLSVQKSTDKLDPSKLIFPCNAKVSLSEKSVFRVKPHGGRTNPVKRISPVNLWPPTTIPAIGRTQQTGQAQNGDHSMDLFRLDDQHPAASTFAAIDPFLFTADAQHPYRGVWVGTWPMLLSI